MPKLKNFIISYHVYAYDLMVSLGQTDKELSRDLKKYGMEFNDDLKAGIGSKGRAMMFNNGATIIRLFEYPTTNEHYATLQHEIFHAVVFLMNKVGMKLSDKSDEAYAHLIGYLTKEIYNKI